jgi:PIN domain nuclease of toxin-antitoxin system
MVVDASALMAFFLKETGDEAVKKELEKGNLLISTVNRTEVKGKLVGSGTHTPQMIDTRFDLLKDVLEVVAFDAEQSDIAAFYYARRNPYNLSLGDCACLALAEVSQQNVLTAEQAWKKLPHLPFKVVLIR